jgi:hypothetical protein
VTTRDRGISEEDRIVPSGMVTTLASGSDAAGSPKKDSLEHAPTQSRRRILKAPKPLFILLIVYYIFALVTCPFSVVKIFHA